MIWLSIDYIFDDSESRIEGLQHKRLGKESCAIFVYDEPNYRKFHMSNVPCNLYLSVIDGDRCIESQFMHANTTYSHSLTNKAQVVVESRIKIPEGALVSINDDFLVFSWQGQ